MSIAPVPAAEGNTLAWIDAVDPLTATIARGILQHHEDDASFHVTQDFAQLNIRFAKQINFNSSAKIVGCRYNRNRLFSYINTAF